MQISVFWKSIWILGRMKLFRAKFYEYDETWTLNFFVVVECNVHTEMSTNHKYVAWEFSEMEHCWVTTTQSKNRDVTSSRKAPHAPSDRLTSPKISAILKPSNRDCLTYFWTWYHRSLQYVHFCAWLFPHYVYEIHVWYHRQQFILSHGCILFHCMNWLIGSLAIINSAESILVNVLSVTLGIAG